MEKTKWKIVIGIMIFSSWLLLISGVIKVPALVWLGLGVITILFYLSLTGRSLFRKGSTEEVIEEMEGYMERKAEETDLDELKRDDDSEAQKQEKDE